MIVIIPEVCRRKFRIAISWSTPARRFSADSVAPLVGALRFVACRCGAPYVNRESHKFCEPMSFERSRLRSSSACHPHRKILGLKPICEFRAGAERQREGNRRNKKNEGAPREQ